MMGIFIKIQNAYNRFAWNREKKNFNKVGQNCKCLNNFSIRDAKYICIGDNFRGGQNISIHAWKEYHGEINPNNPQISIGNNVSMTKNSYISCADKVLIKDGVLIGENVFITDNMHGGNTKKEINIPPASRRLYSKGKVVIGENVWLGRNVCVMPNVTIGKGTIVGANAVVTHDLPERCIAVGVPAKPIKFIDDNA